METLQRYRAFAYDSGRWEGFAFRADDIVISVPIKSGTTWMQAICALLVFGDADFDRPMTELSPCLEHLTAPLDEVVAALEAQEHRRFIKSHTPLDGLPFDERVTYICVGRDPRDVSLSLDNHIASMDIGRYVERRIEVVGAEDLAGLPPAPSEPRPDDHVARFRWWIEDPPLAEPAQPVRRGTLQNLRGVLHHLATFWERRHEPNVVLIHYSDLETDLEGEMRQLAGRLGIEIPQERWPGLVDAARFDRMKARASQLVPEVVHGVWPDPSRFFHHGRSGRWREVLDPVDLERYEERVAELIQPDLAAWVHGGRRTSPCLAEERYPRHGPADRRGTDIQERIAPIF